MSRQQKEDERRFFNQMREALGGVPQGSVDQPDPPEPDIVVTSPPTMVGIEVTELYPAGPIGKLKASEEDGIVERTVRELRLRGVSPLEFRVYWKPTFIPNRSDRSLSTELAEIIATRNPALGSQIVLASEYDYDEFFEHRAIERIDIGRFGEYEDFAWGCPRRGWQMSLPPDVLQWTIDKKKDKPRAYERPYTSKWLLIVAEGADPSSWYEFGDSLTHFKFDSPFGRVIFLDCLRKSAKNIV
jgi:hypothetical protein